MTSNNREIFDIDREKANVMTDLELSKYLEKIWEDGDFPNVDLSDDEKERLYGDIASRISLDDDSCQSTPMKIDKKIHFRKILRYAAAVLLPVLVLSNVYLFYKDWQRIDCLSEVRTAMGETATVTLPDGSEIRINNGSAISYNPYSFAKGKRKVTLHGEAFFSVKSDERHPFSVNAGEVTVKVLGTKFNVQSYANDDDITVLLTEGAVEMRCDGIAQSITLDPWQKAVFDKATHTAEVLEVDNDDSDIAWLNNEMSFSNSPFAEVVKAIEMSYGVKFDSEILHGLKDDGFTGTLPSDDISTVLDIIEDVYGVSFTINGRDIILK